MKNIILFITLFLSFTYTSSYAELTLGNKIPVVGGNTVSMPTNIWNAWDSLFNWSGLNFELNAEEPYVDASTDNTGNNAKFYGNYRLENVGWVTFNFWDEANRARLQTIDSTKLLMKWFAWSENSGWIAFDWNNGNIGTADDGSVYYDKTTRTLKWFAWSDNLWFIPMTGVEFDIVWPILDPSISKPFAANHDKTINITTSPTPWNTVTIKIDSWNTGTGSISNGDSFDFRKAKDYAYDITDLFGNKLTGFFDVVSSTPSSTLHANNIWGWATATTYSSNLTSAKIADGNDNFYFTMALRDTYGNIIKSESGIKDVKVEVVMNNNVDRNQISNSNLWDAIIYANNDFSMTYGMFGNSGTGSNTTGNYTLEIASVAPSSTWYDKTSTNNDIYIQSLKYTINSLWGNSWVGEIGTAEISPPEIPKWASNALSFTPAIKVANADNSDNWNIIQGNESETTYNVIESKTSGSTDINNIQVANILNLWSNLLMSFQDLSVDGSDHCSGFSYSSPAYKTWWPVPSDCSSYNPRSILINKLPNFTSTSNSISKTLKVTPKIIVISPSNLNYDYNTQIMYDGLLSGVKYNSFSKSISWGSGVVNTQIKILGQTNDTKNIVNFVEWSNYNSLWNLSKNELKTQMIKNAYSIIKNGQDSGSIKLYNGDTSITSWPTGKDTIIVNGWNLYLEWDITKTSWVVKTIVVTKNADKTWGNIFVKNNIQKINAVLIAEWALISGTSSTYYADTNNWATNQLYIYGSLFSNNTVGGSSKTTPTCPVDITSWCTLQVSKRYDLNHFRHYIKWVHTTAISGYDEYPFIIKYDPDIALGKNKFLLTK